MKLSSKLGAAILSIVFLFFSVLSASAQYRYEFRPAISASETYEDNIYLDPANEIADYITTITPSVDFNTESEKTGLRLFYAPSFVFYDENTDYNTTRHLATLSWGQDLAQHIRVDLRDTYNRSEEPIERAEDVQGVRRTRQRYWRNTGDTSLQFFFGPQNTVTFGYGQNYLENEDPNLDDGRIQTPLATLTYWFNVKNGVELNYEYTKADFWLDLGEADDDYTGNAAGIRFIHSSNPQTSVFIRYDFATRDFDGLTEDYNVHEGFAGFEYSFSPETSISLSGGYFVKDNERSKSEDGPTYNILLTRRFERGSFTVGGTGGWNESYLDVERRGFTRYYSGNTRVEYQVAEPLSFYAGGTYRLDRDNTSREWDTWRGNAGISLTFLRYLSLSLDYRYAERDDDMDTEDYESNRVMLTLTASKLYK